MKHALTASIAASLFVLPLFEAPKNLLLFLTLVFFIWQQTRGAFSRGHNLDKTAILYLVSLLIIFLSITPLFTLPQDSISLALKSAMSWGKYGIFAAIVFWSTRDRIQVTLYIFSILAGGLIAVIWELFVWNSGSTYYPELNSVGHVNQSAIYVALLVVTGISALFCRSFPIGVRLIGGVTVVASLVILVPMYSVITTVALAIAMLLMLFVLAGWKGLAALFLASALLYQLPIPGLQKQLQTLANQITSRASSADPDSKRGELLNVAFITAMENRFVGAGHKSFPVAATEEVVKGYLESQGLKYNRSEYHYDVHGHSYWTTSLVEKGALGILGGLLLFLSWSLVCWPISRNFAGVLGLGVLGISALISVGNTVLHNEHGGLALALMSLVFAIKNQRMSI